MLPANYRNIPQYKCHKVVWAFKIARIDNTGPTNYLISADDKITPIAISRDQVESKNPSVGDYYVLYEDGYSSFSRAKAFENGYDHLVGGDTEGANGSNDKVVPEVKNEKIGGGEEKSPEAPPPETSKDSVPHFPSDKA